MDEKGQAVRVKYSKFLVVRGKLQVAFRREMKSGLEAKDWEVDPKVWDLDWGVHIRAVGSGVQAIKYLGNYVAKTAIKDGRIIEVDEEKVSFRWRDRSDNNRMKPMQIPGVEFARRYLKHVLPRGLRSVRYYGFCHPVAKANRMRVKFNTGMKVQLGVLLEKKTSGEGVAKCTSCPACGGPTIKLYRMEPSHRKRGPPMWRRSISPSAE